jgi:hypothetical protein
VQGTAAAPIAQVFGIVFAAAMFALFAATVPPLHDATGACDALSAAHLTAAGIGGIGLAALASLHALRSSVARRLTGASVLAVVLAAVLAVTYPACLGDPFVRLDSRLSTLWLSHVNEARSIASMLRDLPQEILPYYGLPVAALVLSCLQIARSSAGRAGAGFAAPRCSVACFCSPFGWCVAQRLRMQFRLRSLQRRWCVCCRPKKHRRISD